MGKTLYLECNSGISGDMTVAALLDLGADEQVLLQTLENLHLDSYQIKIGRTKKCGIDACDFDVILEEDLNYTESNNYDFSHIQEHTDQEYTNHGHIHDQEHSSQIYVHTDYEHLHDHEHTDHDHSHEHEQAHHEHSHEHEQAHHEHTHENEHTHHAHPHEHEQAHHEHPHEHEQAHHEHPHEYEQTHHEHPHEYEQTHHEHPYEHEQIHHEHPHEHEHTHHEHPHDHGSQQENTHNHNHQHRNLKDVYEIIDHLDDADIKNTAKKIFEVVAKAEAKAHGIPIEEVHFHEVGAVDSIVDIVAAAICLKNLDITEVIVSPLAEGTGYAKCQHGVIPVPVPAVLNIVMMNDLTMKNTNNRGEMITPTGAAIAAAVRTKDSLPDFYTVKGIGIGAGKKEFTTANILRAIIIEETQQNSEKEYQDTIWKLESNIDDCTGEAMGYTLEKLMAAGARDVFYTPIYMKKNRPAYLLTVLCKKADIEIMEDIIFSHTTTIGIRKIAYERTIMERDIVSFESSYGRVKVKVCKRGDRKVCYPEYESVREICEKAEMEFQQVYASIIHQYYQKAAEEE